MKMTVFKKHYMPRKKHIRDLDALDREIILLKKRALKIQHAMDEQMLHLKENSGSMFWNTLVKGGGKHAFTTTVLSVVLQNEKVQGLIRQLTGKLADFIGKATGKMFMSESDTDLGVEKDQ
jgi:hypothetical protein